MGRALRGSAALEAGMVWINTYRAVSYMAPFGGYKRSGLGRESGQEAIEKLPTDQDGVDRHNRQDRQSVRPALDHNREYIMDMIGFIGLGRMGRPMASNLSRKGFRLVVHDVNRKAVEELELLQARGAANAAQVAAEGDVIVTMLPNSAIVSEVVTGA